MSYWFGLKTADESFLHFPTPVQTSVVNLDEQGCALLPKICVATAEWEQTGFKINGVATNCLLRVRRIQSTVHYYINISQHFQKYLLLSRYPSFQVFNHHLLTSLFLTKFVMSYQWWITLNLGCYHVWVRLYRFWSVASGWQVRQTRPLFWQRCLFIFLSGLKLNACHRDVPLAVSERSWKLSNKKLQCHGFMLLMWLRKGTRHPGSKGFCPC